MLFGIVEIKHGAKETLVINPEGNKNKNRQLKPLMRINFISPIHQRCAELAESSYYYMKNMWEVHMKEQIKQINEIMKEVLGITNKKEGVCLYMGALLFAQIHDNFELKPRFVTGSLTLYDRLVFAHKPIKPVFSAGSDFSGIWDGHAWVEVDDYIFDASIFWTIYSSNTPEELQSLFNLAFNGKRDYLIGSRTLLEKSGVVYKAFEELSDGDATILINSGFNAGIFDRSI
ncbi:hypothetical protein SMQE01_13100 [Serratia marcescens]|nr:hypothetical protein SMQE01_13100 [Serratia marcescens]